LHGFGDTGRPQHLSAGPTPSGCVGNGPYPDDGQGVGAQSLELPTVRRPCVRSPRRPVTNPRGQARSRAGHRRLQASHRGEGSCGRLLGARQSGVEAALGAPQAGYARSAEACGSTELLDGVERWPNSAVRPGRTVDRRDPTEVYWQLALATNKGGDKLGRDKMSGATPVAATTEQPRARGGFASRLCALRPRLCGLRAHRHLADGGRGADASA